MISWLNSGMAKSDTAARVLLFIPPNTQGISTPIIAPEKELANFCCLLGRDIHFQLPRILRKDGAEIIEHILLQAVLSVVGQGVAVEHFVFQEIGFQCC